MNVKRHSRVEIHTKTGEVLKGAWTVGDPSEVFGEFRCWGERWESLAVMYLLAEDGTIRAIPKGSVDYWEIVSELFEESEKEENNG